MKKVHLWFPHDTRQVGGLHEPRRPRSRGAEEIGAFSRSSVLIGMEGTPETLPDQEAGPEHNFGAFFWLQLLFRSVKGCPSYKVAIFTTQLGGVFTHRPTKTFKPLCMPCTKPQHSNLKSERNLTFSMPALPTPLNSMAREAHTAGEAKPAAGSEASLPPPGPLLQRALPRGFRVKGLGFGVLGFSAAQECVSFRGALRHKMVEGC